MGFPGSSFLKSLSNFSADGKAAERTVSHSKGGASKQTITKTDTKISSPFSFSRVFKSPPVTNNTKKIEPELSCNNEMNNAGVHTSPCDNTLDQIKKSALTSSSDKIGEEIINEVNAKTGQHNIPPRCTTTTTTPNFSSRNINSETGNIMNLQENETCEQASGPQKEKRYEKNIYSSFGKRRQNDVLINKEQLSPSNPFVYNETSDSLSSCQYIPTPFTPPPPLSAFPVENEFYYMDNSDNEVTTTPSSLLNRLVKNRGPLTPSSVHTATTSMTGESTVKLAYTPTKRSFRFSLKRLSSKQHSSESGKILDKEHFSPISPISTTATATSNSIAGSPTNLNEFSCNERDFLENSSSTNLVYENANMRDIYGPIFIPNFDNSEIFIKYLRSQLKNCKNLNLSHFIVGKTVGTGSFGRVVVSQLRYDILLQVLTAKPNNPFFLVDRSSENNSFLNNKEENDLKLINKANCVETFNNTCTIQSENKDFLTLPVTWRLKTGSTALPYDGDYVPDDYLRESYAFNLAHKNYKSEQSYISNHNRTNRSRFSAQMKSLNTPFVLKILHKKRLLELKQVNHVKDEKNILINLSHPFIINLVSSFQDKLRVVLMMEFVNGGELFTLLRKRNKISFGEARFYAAEIVCAFQYLHAQDIAYRDLKPENLLIDSEGHIRIADFGFSKVLPDKKLTYTLCGTHEYLAPETVLRQGHGMPVDWWALGILIYEMLVGKPPFTADTPMGIYQKILANKPPYPSFLHPDCRSIMKRLLLPDPEKRLGCAKGGCYEVMLHRFFRSIDWHECNRKLITPPNIPSVAGPFDTSRFEKYQEYNGSFDSNTDPDPKKLFEDF